MFNGILVILIGIVGIVLVFELVKYSKSDNKSEFNKKVEDIALLTKYMSVSDDAIKSAMEELEEGNRASFMALIERIKGECGKETVKAGHIYWALDVIAGKTDGTKIPVFDEKQTIQA